jgi:hypothetical protein
MRLLPAEMSARPGSDDLGMASSCLGYTRRAADTVARATLDPQATFASGRMRFADAQPILRATSPELLLVVHEDVVAGERPASSACGRDGLRLAVWRHDGGADHDEVAVLETGEDFGVGIDPRVGARVKVG